MVADSCSRKFANIQLKYRNLDNTDIQKVFDDIYQTSLNICLQGQLDSERFKLLQDGIKRIQSFIHSERYYLDVSIINASKVAYLITLLSNNLMEVEHFIPCNSPEIDNITIENPLPTKLNKLKKNNREAFFYWWKVNEIIKNKYNFAMRTQPFDHLGEIYKSQSDSIKS